jgi:hypothetical protein
MSVSCCLGVYLGNTHACVHACNLDEMPKDDDDDGFRRAKVIAKGARLSSKPNMQQQQRR